LPVVNRAFFPHFQSRSNQFKANIFPLKTTMHSSLCTLPCFSFLRPAPSLATTQSSFVPCRL
jgi:hypothetical protein